MTGHDAFDRTLARWFEADASPSAPSGRLDQVIDATRRRRPRPAWLATPGSHWVGEAHDASSGVGMLRALPMRSPPALVVLLLIAALVGGAILVGGRLLQIPPPAMGGLGNLAYVLDGDVYVAGWDGRNPVRIADGDPIGGVGAAACGSFGDPVWSPDGQKLAYRSGSAFCPGAIVHVSDPTGHVFASFPGTGWRLSWAPDSGRVATWVALSQTIGVYGLDGERQALLTLPPGLGPIGDFDPVWSPDGRSLLIPLGPPMPNTIWEIPVNGGTPRAVPEEDPRSQRAIAYSFDQARVAFAQPTQWVDERGSLVFDRDAFVLVVANADGTGRRVLIGQDVISGPVDAGDAYTNIVWSPSADRIAFTWSRTQQAFDQAGNPLPGPQELRTVELASGAVTRLATGRGVSSPFEVVGFEPEGDRIIYLRTDADNVSELWRVGADGSDAQVLVAEIIAGDWQPPQMGS